MNTLIFLFKNREKSDDLKRVFKLMLKRVYQFIPLMAIIFKTKKLTIKKAKIGKLTIVGKAKIEGRNLEKLQIGEQTSIGRCEISLHDNVSIGDNVAINDGVILLTGSHALSDPKWRHKTAPIIIGDFAWISTNAIILPGVKVGKGAVIGAGAVVRESVPEYSIVLGNPAKVVENRKRTDNLDYSPVLFNAPYEAWIGRNLYEK